MDLNLVLGLIMVLGAYMGLLVYYDSIIRLKLPPLLVGLRGRVYPLEELVAGEIKEQVDPLELESMYSRRDKALGFTSYFMAIASILGASTIILLIISDEPILIAIPLTMLLFIHLYLYKWSKSIEVNHWVREGKENYIIGLVVKAWPRTRIQIVNEPPPGEVYGSTKAFGEGYVRLEYYWRPKRGGEYHWSPQLIVVEEANGMIRLDFSKKVTYNIIVSSKTGLVERKSKGSTRGAQSSFLLGTIREPEVIGVREYIIGDRLKDIIAKSILKPGGPRVRKYKELLEGLANNKRGSETKIMFILGPLSSASKSYRERILAVASDIVEKPGVKTMFFLNIGEDLYSTSMEALIEGNIRGSPVGDLRVLEEADLFFIDPSITIGIPREKTIVILPYDWRIEVFESYRRAWEKYLGELEDVYGSVKKI